MQTGDLGAESQNRTAADGRLHEPGRGEHRLHLRIARIERAARKPRREMRFELSEARRVDELIRHTAARLVGSGARQRRERLGGLGDDDPALVLELEALGAELVGEVRPELAGAQRHRQLRAGRLVRDQQVALAGAGRAGGNRLPLEHGHRMTRSGRVQRAGRSHDSRADDCDLCHLSTMSHSTAAAKRADDHQLLGGPGHGDIPVDGAFDARPE